MYFKRLSSYLLGIFTIFMLGNISTFSQAPLDKTTITVSNPASLAENITGNIAENSTEKRHEILQGSIRTHACTNKLFL